MKISVIIPTLNEAPRIAALIGAVRNDDPTADIVVVDGHSSDGTARIARLAGARCFVVPPGRGRQIAYGATKASGEVLLFLHADSVYPAGGLGAVRCALADEATVGGNFRLLFDGDDDFSRWLNGFYQRIRARGVYYGDSGIFCRSTTYQKLGGIRPIDLMEDFDFVRRMERSGPTTCIPDPSMITSSRRFEGRRPFAIVWGWIVIHALFLLGVSPTNLARLYRSDRRGRKQSAGQTHEKGGPDMGAKRKGLSA